MTDSSMSTSTTKRFILPFSNKKYDEFEIESAAVFALSEHVRNKGGGLFYRQKEEKIVFITKLGYPLWLFPKREHAFLFDGLSFCNFRFKYLMIPSIRDFIESLEARSRPRENYTSFLADHNSYFKRAVQERSLPLEGLISDSEVLSEFISYRKETVDSASLNMALFLPTLHETAVVKTLLELDKVELFFDEIGQLLPECLRLIRKTTSQYLTEIEFASTAAKEEIDAKIKAQEEIINQDILKLNKEYGRKTKIASESYDKEIESLHKLKNKTDKLIERTIDEIKHLKRESDEYADKGYLAYKRRWKEKIKKAQKELDVLKKELKETENVIKKIVSKKNQAISKITLELDSEIRLAQQPITELRANREAKLRFFKQEAENLILCEKPVVDDLNIAIRLKENATAHFEKLQIKESALQTPVLFYIPFYMVCYETGSTRRYYSIPPSTINNVDLSTKLMGVFAKSKIQNILKPHFKAITTLIQLVPVYAKQNTVFEDQLLDISQKNNLLKTNSFLEKARKGLATLNRNGWLSEQELQILNNKLAL